MAKPVKTLKSHYPMIQFLILFNHWIMQFKNFHWPSHHGIIEPLYHVLQIGKNVHTCIQVQFFGASLYYYISLCFLSYRHFLKIITPTVLVGYEITIASIITY